MKNKLVKKFPIEERYVWFVNEREKIRIKKEKNKLSIKIKIK